MSTKPITKDYLLTQLKNFDAAILEEKYAQLGNISIKRLDSPTTGFLASYQLLNGQEVLGDTIDIPKDWLLKKVEIKTVEVADVPVVGYKVGDKYFDFEFNTKDSASGTETSTHQYLLITELAQVYSAGDGIAISNANAISVDSGDGLTIDATSKKLKVNVGAGLAIDPTSEQLKVDFETENIDFENDWE